MSLFGKDFWRGARGLLDSQVPGLSSLRGTLPIGGYSPKDPLETYEKPSYKSGSGLATGGTGIIIIAAAAALALGWIKL